MRRYAFVVAVLFLLALIAFVQQPINANPQGGSQNYLALVNGPHPTPTPTVTPSPTPTPPYPAVPWSLQLGETTYDSNNALYWVEGRTFLEDGTTPAVGDRFQICSREGRGCSGPSAASRDNGFFDWVMFNGGSDETDGDGRYYAVLVNCDGIPGNPHSETIGSWPPCPERSEQVNFRLESNNGRMIAKINWYRVATSPAP